VSRAPDLLPPIAPERGVEPVDDGRALLENTIGFGLAVQHAGATPKRLKREVQKDVGRLRSAHQLATEGVGVETQAEGVTEDEQGDPH
jgi:hypothetical protein